MSKDIWHTADKAPDPCKSFVIKTDKGNIYTGVITNPTEWNTIILPEFYSIADIDKAEHIIQYAYIEDLLALKTELERTRKALDVAVDGLGKMTWGCDSSDAEHLLKEIEEITALEQKDVK